MNHFYKKTTLAFVGGLLCLFLGIFVVIQIGSGSLESQEDSIIESRQDSDPRECTIGVASGRATQDGRPMIWKTSDGAANPRGGGLYHDESMKYAYKGLIVAENINKIWYGFNEAGFAIANSSSSDMSISPYGRENGGMMKLALGNCATVADFERIMDSTNTVGRKTDANFVVLDATGAAKIIEADGYNYWVYDANNEEDAPDGYILRTNFTVAGGGTDGIERFRRTTQIMSEFSSGDSLSFKSILRHQMRDFSSIDGIKRNVPFDRKLYPESPHGFYNSGVSICNYNSRSCIVIQGVKENEDPRLTTMWTIGGHPASTVAVPYWIVGSLPVEIRGDLGIESQLLIGIAKLIRDELFETYFLSEFNREFELIDTYKLLDGNGGGLWTMIFPLEDTIIKRAQDNLEIWRQSGLDIREMMTLNAELAAFAYSELVNIYDKMFGTSSIDQLELADQKVTISNVYPNPSSGNTNIEIELKENRDLSIMIFNSSGQLIKNIYQQKTLPAGNNLLKWDGYNDNGNRVPQGIYHIVLTTSGTRVSKTCIRI